MRILIFIVITALVQSFAQAQQIFQIPETVRVRTFKNLREWPQIKGAHVVGLNDYAWSATGADLKFQGKKLSTQNVILKNGGDFEIISVFEFNRYLTGVVASEMPVNWPMEALKAQAVVARSFTLAKLLEKSGNKSQRRYFDMEADVSDQMFAVTESLRASMAVIETDGVTLNDRRGQTLKAFYHSDCGGETVNANEVWGGGGFQSGTARDPWCLARPSSAWSFEMDKAEFFKRLGLSADSAYTGKLNWVGRSQLVSIMGLTFSVQKLRQIFGFSKLKSTPSQLEIGEQKVRFTGQGFGHGAGLCQWGSRAQALKGRGYRDILSHYYPNAILTQAKPRMASVLLPERPLIAAEFAVSR